jgi:hypothetical protein
MVYDMIIPTIPVIVGYLITYALYRGNLIRKSLHVNLWNMVIGVSFLIAGGAGFLLLILMEAGVIADFSPQLLYWHVEFGVTIALVTIFHFHTYWKTSRKMFLATRRRSRT